MMTVSKIFISLIMWNIDNLALSPNNSLGLEKIHIRKEALMKEFLMSLDGIFFRYSKRLFIEFEFKI